MSYKVTNTPDFTPPESHKSPDLPPFQKPSTPLPAIFPEVHFRCFTPKLYGFCHGNGHIHHERWGWMELQSASLIHAVIRMLEASQAHRPTQTTAKFIQYSLFNSTKWKSRKHHIQALLMRENFPRQRKLFSQSEKKFFLVRKIIRAFGGENLPEITAMRTCVKKNAKE